MRIKKEKAITLVALIITIIILLILATVSISLVINNGILDKAKTAVDKYSDGEIEEQIKLAYQEYEMEQFTGTELSAKDFIKNKLNNIYGEGTVTDITQRGNSFIVVFLNGKIYTYNSSKGILADITNKTNISKSVNENFVGCYADIDADGEVDGVIFADLLVGNTKGNQWENENGTYEISTKSADTLRNYYISKENHDGIFGTENVLSPKGVGEDRFYVMSLKNFEVASYIEFYWYKNAYGRINVSDTSLDFGLGKTNTKTIIDRWNRNGKEGGYANAIQENQDIWKYIQTEYENGWFLPSKAEWAAFANELNITNSNFSSSFKLSRAYWSSSSNDAFYIKRINFYNGYIDNAGSHEYNKVRLATIF